MSHGSDGGDDYWPGYVDALTAMVQVLAFVMMLLAVAVFVLSQSVSKNVVEQIAKAANVETPANATVAELTTKVLEQLEKGVPKKSSGPPPDPEAKPATEPAPVPQTMTSLKPYTKTVQGSVTNPADRKPDTPTDGNHVRVSFTERSYRIDSANAAAIEGFIEAKKLGEGGKRVTIRAYASDAEGAVSEARRLAYYRSMVARKALIERKVPANAIEIRIFDTPDKIQGGTIDIVTGSEP